MVEESPVESREGDGSGKGYQPPEGLPFRSTGSFQGDRQQYLNVRDAVYGENTKRLKQAWSNKSSGKEILDAREKLTTIDKFFDIVDEC